MKKVIIIIASVLALLVLTFFFVFIFPFLGTSNALPGTEFAGGKIIRVVDGMSQVFIVNGGNGRIALVDAGNSPDGGPILDALKSKGFTASDVKAVFLTHGHKDHIAAAKVFSGAIFYALKDEVDIAGGPRKKISPIGKLFASEPTGFTVTGVLKDGDVVPFGLTKVEVFSVPGHTDGSAVYLIDGVLFMGDTSLSSSDGKIRPPVWVFSNDVEQGSRSLKALAVRLTPRKDSVTFIVFSHSGEVEGLQPLIDFARSVR